MIHWLHGGQVRRYFRGRLGGQATDRLLARIWRCAECRVLYERHLLLESMLPDGESRRDDRLWGAIERSAELAGAPTPSHRPAPALPWLAVGAAMALLVLVPRFWSTNHKVSEPVARGGAAAPAVAPALFVYRSLGPRRSEPVARTVRAGDGLLLAYSNPTADLRFLMVFAVDGGGRVYWYHPAYERAGENPTAVPIRTQAFGVELGDEVHHALAPGRMTLFALFLPRPASVLEIEALVRRDRVRADLPGATVVELPLEVTP